jgi:hypothetical protein
MTIVKKAKIDCNIFKINFHGMQNSKQEGSSRRSSQ